MNCKETEARLPAYVEGDLSAEESAALAAHLEQCEVCSESLAFYTRLEQSLSRRHMERSVATGAADRALASIGHAKSEREGRRWGVFGVLSFTPAMMSAAFIVIGVVLLFKRDLLQRVFSGFSMEGFTYRLTVLLERIGSEATAVSLGNEWMLLSIYLGVFALILLSGSLMVLRFVRD